MWIHGGNPGLNKILIHPKLIKFLEESSPENRVGLIKKKYNHSITVKSLFCAG